MATTDSSTDRSTNTIPVAGRVHRFSYAIRNIVAEARRVEASGKTVRYLNIGDPVAFGFRTPPALVAVVERAMRDGHNGYGPSEGLAGAPASSGLPWPPGAIGPLLTGPGLAGAPASSGLLRPPGAVGPGRG